MEKLKTIIKWRWLRALQIWNNLPIRAQGGVTVFIPIVAVLISFGFAIYGNRSREERQTDIQRKFRAVRQYGDLLNLMVDAETGERGYLLTKRSEYLAPYEKAVAEIPQTVNELKETVEAEPGNKPRAERLESLTKIQELVNRQLVLLKESQNFNRDAEADKLYEYLQSGKSLMDEIRAAVGAMQNKEAALLDDRIEEINSIRNRDYIVVFIVLLVGIIVRVVSFYLFDRGIVRRVERMSDYADAVLKNESAVYAASGKTDAVGVLEEKAFVSLNKRNSSTSANNPGLCANGSPPKIATPSRPNFGSRSSSATVFTETNFARFVQVRKRRVGNF